ncbi:MAG TPA: TraB/GumN family protein [Sphingomicrobium sp.]|nr:TraB/GumN family protein [Sphingomicrobium sp.]
MVNLLIAAALAAAMPQAAPPAAPVEPAMFVVHDADTTIYLFGTFHALDSKTQWYSQDVRNAFESSDELVLETLIPEGPGPVIPGKPGLPIRAPTVVPSASFLATARMAINAGQSQGMQVDNGADMILRHIAEQERKPVEGLETLEFQLNMFNSLPPPAAKAQPKPRPGQPATEESMQSLSKTMAQMESAWKRGDQSVFVNMLDQLDQQSPDTYRLMFTERNARWADWIAARLQTPGTVFIAVGAGHLAGKDSLLVRLAEKGIASQRVY